MSSEPAVRTGLVPGLLGFVQGFVSSVILFGTLRYLRVGPAVQYEWQNLFLCAVLVGVIFALGKGIAGRLAGALLGGFAGLILGGWISWFLPPWSISFVVYDPTPFVAGKPLPLSGPGLDGKTIDVADYRGKVVLVDFWATWCGPCLHEIPNVKAAYEKYHDQGFEVLAVSLDQNREDLESYISKHKLPWKQIFFEEPDKRGWKNPLVQQLGIQGIPATYLLNREGNIVAVDLRGPELGKEVGRALEEEDGLLESELPGMSKRLVRIPLSTLVGAIGLAWLLAWAQRPSTRMGPTTS